MNAYLFRKSERLPEGRVETVTLAIGETEHQVRATEKIDRDWERVFDIEAMPHTELRALPTPRQQRAEASATFGEILLSYYRVRTADDGPDKPLDDETANNIDSAIYRASVGDYTGAFELLTP